MGAPWREHPSFSIVERASKASGEPLADLVCSADAATLGRTKYAQLAVLTTSLVAWDALGNHLDAPVAFAGHSLGQVTALIAAGTMSLEEGVRFAARRADLTQRAADENPGRMAALLGASVEQATAVVDGTTSWLANLNAPGQIVIAGTPTGIDDACERAQAAGVRRCRVLDVDGAFHTPLMSSARVGLEDALGSVTLNAPSAPIVSNEDGEPYDDADEWRKRLAVHPTVPVRWADCMQTLSRLGATTIVEVGHGSMIAGLAKRTIPQVSVLGLGTPDDLGRVLEVLR